jgi:hypothetical protein
MKYVLQHPDFALGNFINITPAIKWRFKTTGERVPVYFATDYVKQCFLDWPLIEILDEQPVAAPRFGSDLVNPINNLPDYQYSFQKITGMEWTPEFHTYVDTPPLTRQELEAWDGCIAVTNGAGNPDPKYVAGKDPGKDAFLYAIKVARATYKKARVIATGSVDDLRRNPWMKEHCDECYFGDIRRSLKIISAATFVLANDTGLAHAAGAMNQNLMVLMKNTPAIRVKNPGERTEYVYL